MLSSSIPYRSDIDGLRALSIILVLMFHAGLGVSGGFVGVDVFFVISGYLITGSISHHIQMGTFSIGGFWVRRIRRLLPASLCMIAFVLLWGMIALPRSAREELSHSVIANQALCANWYFWSISGYFAGPSESKALLHTWSLAVEEQFYLLYPLVLSLLLQRGRWCAIVALVFLAIASLLFSEYCAHRYPTFNYFSLPTRAWELLLGCVLALLPTVQPFTGFVRNVICGAALCAIIAPAIVYTSNTRFPGLAALAPTVGAALFILINSTSLTWLGKVLTAGPIVALGKISYSVYLWHWPIHVIARHSFGDEQSLLTRFVLVLASVVIGGGSWACVEEPVRRGQVFGGTTRFLQMALTLSVCTILIAAATAEMSRSEPGNQSKVASHFGRDESLPHGVLAIGVVGAPDSEREFLLWGDSHAGSLTQLFAELAEARGIRGAVARRDGYAPLVGVYNDINVIESSKFQLEYSENIADTAVQLRVKHVFLVSRWECKIGCVGDGAADRIDGTIKDGKSKQTSVEDSTRVFREGLRRTIQHLRAAGIKVWFVMQAPVQDGDMVEKARQSLWYWSMMRGVTEAQYGRQQRQVAVVLQGDGWDDLSVIGPSPGWFDAMSFSRISNGTEDFYSDDDHLSAEGAAYYYRNLLVPVFDQMARRQ
jgi:peptidoglycan/LPS O-acetylase OafA/YrhL